MKLISLALMLLWSDPALAQPPRNPITFERINQVGSVAQALCPTVAAGVQTGVEVSRYAREHGFTATEQLLLLYLCRSYFQGVAAGLQR
jgi:hypothetical protein